MEVHQEFTYRSRPFKVAKIDKRFKGIVASNLKELKEKSINTFNMETLIENVDVTLAEDDTLIDDEDYFATLPENTKLIINIIKNYHDYDDTDVTDGGLQIDTEKNESQEIYDTSAHSMSLPLVITNKLNSKNVSECIIAFITMSNEELETILKHDFNVLSEELNIDESLARLYIDNASKELLRREELSEATQLINLFQKAKEKCMDPGEVNRKRPKN